MKRAGIGACCALLVALAASYFGGGLSPAASAPDGGYAAPQQNQARRSGSQIAIGGRVTRILADDRDGSRHQRFIIRVDGGETLLIAHNIDLAPRLDGLKVGDWVSVAGEFVWNPQGGTVHWTHHDPQQRHVPGYVEWRGRRYQ